MNSLLYMFGLLSISFASTSRFSVIPACDTGVAVVSLNHNFVLKCILRVTVMQKLSFDIYYWRAEGIRIVDMPVLLLSDYADLTSCFSIDTAKVILFCNSDIHIPHVAIPKTHNLFILI